jgi:hypothetical protein
MPESIEMERGLGLERIREWGQEPIQELEREQGLELQREREPALGLVALGPELELGVELEPAGPVALVARVAADGKRF